MTKFSKSLTGIVIFILFCSISINAEEYTITETFDDVVIGTEGTIVNYYIEADGIVDDTNDPIPTTIYKKYSVEGTCEAEVIVKERNKNITPFINGSGEFVTGNSDIFTNGISEWYSVSGLRYKLPQTCNSVGVVFDYYNIDDEDAGISIIIQRVDDSGVVLWEDTWRLSNYMSWVSDWSSVTYGPERFVDRIQGREFNVIWIVATEMSIQSNEGSYLNNLNITLNTVDAIVVGTNCEVEVEELTTRVDELAMETSYKTSEINTLTSTNSVLETENTNLSKQIVVLSSTTELDTCKNTNVELSRLIDLLTAENSRLAMNTTNDELVTENKELLNKLNILIAENERLASVDTTKDCTTEIEELTEKINSLEQENNLSIAERLSLLFEKSCPIEGEWKNHGQYVKCVAKLRNSLAKEYTMYLKHMVKLAAISDIGKRERVKYHKISMN